MIRGLASLTTALLATCTAHAADTNVDLPRFPSLSPDGSEMAFSWRGDLWRVPTDGGRATRLTAHPGDELQSVWSPDGARIAFTSMRDGAGNVYVMNADGSAIEQLTDTDRPCTVSAFTDDGVWVTSNREADVYRENRPYLVSLDGGPLERVHDAFGSEPVPSPNERYVLFSRGGYYDGWERRHYRGPEAADVWLFDTRNNAFRQLTEWNGNDGRARWLSNDRIIFMSDREDRCVNLYSMSRRNGGDSAERLTFFTDHDVRGFDVSADGRTAVFVVWDTVYRLDLTDDDASPVAVEILASEDTVDAWELRSIDRDVSEAALSPDGKVVAMVAFGDVYIRHVDDDRPTRRVTTDIARERDLAWAPDGTRLYFMSDRDGTESIYEATVERTRSEILEYFEPEDEPDDDDTDTDAADDDERDDAGDDGDGDDTSDASDESDSDDDDESKRDDEDDADDAARWHDAVRFAIAPVVQRTSNDREPTPSPDGTQLAFRGTRGDIHVLDLTTNAIRTIQESWDAWSTFTWSPDNRHLAIVTQDMNHNSDIWLARADGTGEPVNLTRHPDHDESPSFSADGKVMAFVSDRVNDEYDVYMVYLDRDLEALRGTDLTAYYDDAVKAAKKRKPVAPMTDDDANDDDDDAEVEDDADAADDESLDLDDAYLRLRRMTRREGSESSAMITPGGDRIVFTAGGDSSGLYSIKYDRSDEKRLTGNASIQGMSLTGDRVLIVSGGQAHTIKPTGGDRTTLGISQRIRIDRAALASQKIREAARGLAEQYYHPTMNDSDWPRRSREYHDLAIRARTANEFSDIANRMIGELNGSHLSIRMNGPSMPLNESRGYLGIRSRPVNGGFEVLEVIDRGPASNGPMKLEAGDVIRAIEFEPIAPTDTLAARLKGRVGDETIITIARDDATFDVLVTPTSYGALRTLRYNAWRERNAELVHEWSDGRLGYIHIQGMNQPSLDVFERDLFAAAEGREGLIVDVRNNGGGWTADRVLASIMVRPHAYTVPRGQDWAVRGHYPQDRLFIQRYTMPMNMLCNEKSYSNAEIVSHAFKTLGRGTLVGQQTHGSVISTGGWSLLDGTWVRLPFRGWFVQDGHNRDMELNGAMPDLVVPQTPEAEVAGDDEQLRAAVDDLLERMDD